MAFGLLMADIPVYVSCKFEMYIFKIALVISENVCIAFLFVLSILCTKKISILAASRENLLRGSEVYDQVKTQTSLHSYRS